MVHRYFALMLLALCSGAMPVVAAPAESLILATLDRFFAALEVRDANTIGDLLLADGEIIVSRETADGPMLGRTTHADYVTSIGAGDSHLLERIWDPVVQVRGTVASVWTPYDFYVDGKFQHCGVNSFSLILSEGAWKIAAVVYSSRSIDCPPSPLGPPSLSQPPR